MDGPRKCHMSEVSQTEKDKYHIACMWDLKKKSSSECIYKTEIDLQIYKIILWLLGGQQGEGMLWEIGIDIYTLLYIKYVTKDKLGPLLNIMS